MGAVFTSTHPASAQDAGRTGLAFLKIGVGGRAIGMGEAYTALVEDATATLWNPAGLAQMNHGELTFTHNQWIQDVTNEFVALGLGGKNSGLGVSMLVTNVGGIERRVKPSVEPLDILSAHDVAFSFSYAHRVGARWQWGVTAKYLYEKIYIDSASGFALDFGAQGTSKILGAKLGVVAQNLGRMGKLRQESIRLPFTIKLGVAVPIGETAVLSADGVKVVKAGGHFNVGGEYRVHRSLALRAGYQTGFAEKGLSVGVGLGTDRYHLDYAYVPFEADLGKAHQGSLAVEF